MSKNGILKTDFISRCFIYIGKTVYVLSIYPKGEFILRGILFFHLPDQGLYVTFVMSHKPLHVTPRLATSDWLIGRWLYCKLLLYLIYGKMIEKTEIFSEKSENQKFFFQKSGDHSRSSVCTLKNKYYFRFQRYFWGISKLKNYLTTTDGPT